MLMVWDTCSLTTYVERCEWAHWGKLWRTVDASGVTFFSFTFKHLRHLLRHLAPLLSSKSWLQANVAKPASDGPQSSARISSSTAFRHPRC
jgi:hypothetical protein